MTVGLTIKGARKVRDLLSIILATAKSKNMGDISIRVTDDYNSASGKRDVVVELRIPGE